MAIGKLSEVLASDYRGPRAGFTEAHVLKAVISLGEEGFVGRGRLGSLLGLGQGEVRTLIKRLKEKDLITIGINGCILTEKGKKEYHLVSRTVSWFGPVNAKSLEIGRKFYAIIVRGRANKLRLGLEQRDSAIKAGATGALTAIFSTGRFRLPREGTDCEKASPGEPWTAIRKAQPKEGDVIIVSGGEDEQTAEYGAWAAALTLV